MERDRDDKFKLPALKRQRKNLSLNRGHVSSEEASVCSRVVPEKRSLGAQCAGSNREY